MTWRISGASSPRFDADALAYITAVETADEQSLEDGVRYSIDQFVRGCKADGIWSAIKASCILAGARTLSGALVPLVGVAPTRFGTEGGWVYNRKTGLLGNGTNNYLNSGRASNLDPLNNCHLAVYRSSTAALANQYWIGAGTGTVFNILGHAGIYSNSSAFISGSNNSEGLHGFSRSAPSSVVFKRPGAATTSQTLASVSAVALNHYVFAWNNSGLAANYALHPLSFYSIGESLDLALLDARVTTLVSAFAAAIP